MLSELLLGLYLRTGTLAGNKFESKRYFAKPEEKIMMIQSEKEIDCCNSFAKGSGYLSLFHCHNSSTEFTVGIK